jgi:outer membrane protein assembly factor BamB
MSVNRWGKGALLVAAMAGVCLSHVSAGLEGMALAQGTKAAPRRGKAPARKSPAKKSTARGGTASAIDVGEASWPQFLGPNRNNISPESGLLREWPGTGPKLLSTIHGLGVGFSNIAIDDGAVYTVGDRDEREFALAFSLESGEQLWARDIGAAYHESHGDGPRCTPTLDGDFVYVLGAQGAVACLARDTGNPVWTKDLTRDFGTQVPHWAICESVLIDGDRVICTPGGKSATMVAFDKRNGAPLWRCLTPQGDGPAYSSAIAVNVGGVRQYVNYTANGVIGVRAEDGRFMWRDNSSANRMANCCAPVFADEMVFTSSGYGQGSSMLALSSSGGTTKAEFRYHSNDLKIHHGGMVLLNGYVYGMNDNNLTCLHLKTGKVQWQNRSVGKGSLTAADGMLILRSEQGPVALVEVNTEIYKELGRFRPTERSGSPAWTYPVVCGKKLFLRDQDALMVYDLQNQ